MLFRKREDNPLYDMMNKIVREYHLNVLEIDTSDAVQTKQLLDYINTARMKNDSLDKDLEECTYFISLVHSH